MTHFSFTNESTNDDDDDDELADFFMSPDAYERGAMYVLVRSADPMLEIEIEIEISTFYTCKKW